MPIFDIIKSIMGYQKEALAYKRQWSDGCFNPAHFVISQNRQNRFFELTNSFLFYDITNSILRYRKKLIL